MKTSADSLDRNRLEAVWNQEKQSQIQHPKSSGLKEILQRLLKFFVGGNQLRIWQTYDRAGNNWWHAYDPVTGRHTSVDSEAEMRSWIEQRYYH